MVSHDNLFKYWRHTEHKTFSNIQLNIQDTNMCMFLSLFLNLCIGVSENSNWDKITGVPGIGRIRVGKRTLLPVHDMQWRGVLNRVGHCRVRPNSSDDVLCCLESAELKFVSLRRRSAFGAGTKVPYEDASIERCCYHYVAAISFSNIYCIVGSNPHPQWVIVSWTVLTWTTVWVNQSIKSIPR